MGRLRRFLLGSIFTAGLAVSGAGAASAHPHEFVEMKTSVLFDAEGRATGLRYDWTFDEFFTAYAVEPSDTDGDGKPEQAGLDVLFGEIISNITPIDYFTKFDQNGAVPKLGTAVPLGATMVGRQLNLKFDVAFDAPLDLSGVTMRYAIYDEEFYIAMNHAEGDNALTLVNAPARCTQQIEVPDPSEETQDYAASLDKTDTPSTDLGAAFAEWVHVSCP